MPGSWIAPATVAIRGVSRAGAESPIGRIHGRAGKECDPMKRRQSFTPIGRQVARGFTLIELMIGEGAGSCSNGSTPIICPSSTRTV